MKANERGFTLLEVLVAMVILSLAVVTMIQLSSQGLRLVKLSGDHQEATRLADRIARATDIKAEGVDGGKEGVYTWERRITLVPIPKELAMETDPPSGPTIALYSLSIAVRWGSGRSVEVATLRALPVPAKGPGA